MHRRIAVAVLATLFTACDRVENPVAPSLAPSEGSVVTAVAPGGAAYSGRATAIDAQVLLLNKKVCDTGPLPRAGGHINNNYPTYTIPGVLVVGLFECNTHGANNVAISEASVFHMRVTVGGHTIYADVLASMARAACNGSTLSKTGTSSITRLIVDGNLTRVGTGPNYVISLGNGYIIVNEQVGFQSPFGASFTVTALRVVIYGIADLKFSRTHADIDVTCPGSG